MIVLFKKRLSKKISIVHNVVEIHRTNIMSKIYIKIRQTFFCNKYHVQQQKPTLTIFPQKIVNKVFTVTKVLIKTNAIDRGDFF